MNTSPFFVSLEAPATRLEKKVNPAVARRRPDAVHDAVPQRFREASEPGYQAPSASCAELEFDSRAHATVRLGIAQQVGPRFFPRGPAAVDRLRGPGGGPVTMMNKMTWPKKAGSNSSIFSKIGHSDSSNDAVLDIGGSHLDVNLARAHEYTSLRYTASDLVERTFFSSLVLEN